MGIDARIIVRGTVTGDQLESGVKFFADRGCSETVRRSEWSGLVEIDPESRYYGPGYERGYWPTIANAITHARAAFPDQVIAYGGDSSDDENLAEATNELLAENWALWLGRDWDAYHQRKTV